MAVVRRRDDRRQLSKEVHVGLFGKKDSIEEFSGMREALRRAERGAREIAIDSDAAEEPSMQGAETIVETRPMPADQLNGRALPPNGEYASIVSSGSTWQGNLKIEGSVRVDGQLSGEIDARDTVYVAEGAEVDAKVRASVVIIAGKFQGHVDCTERLEITPTGKVRAELATKSLVVHEGAFIDGEIRMTDERPAEVGRAPARPDRATNGAANGGSNGLSKRAELIGPEPILAVSEAS